ncbi:pentapeptide repeat-containing protein [Desulfofustis glycolicus]|uniref:Pentapeptide repeat-containing protein n=1 Tax=Desulfofustis glycolicus DSM 9705 TaxID=1121409 RepID=A0A1M5U348_9BACT|nr:pentapeptide repeat-containing protein [Desulfofustis glycolicus]MCB2214687.1 pentapeptide repeat-containing protein [Desulfobulbaceae bacterium]SHH57291.1 Pentapeptide repeat-containing protein [Desulfofustis glycolicus DSM 9705]
MKITAHKTLVTVLLSGVVGILCQPGLGIAGEEDEQVRNNIDTLIKTNSCAGCELRGADLNRLDLTGADLRDADLSGASLYLVNLADADLRGANLQGAQFGGADLANADLRGADLQGAVFAGAYTVGTKMDDEPGLAEAELDTAEPVADEQDVRSVDGATEEKAGLVEQQVDPMERQRPGSGALQALPEKRIAPPSPVKIDADASPTTSTRPAIPENAPTVAGATEQPAAVGGQQSTDDGPVEAENNRPDDLPASTDQVQAERGGVAPADPDEDLAAALARLLNTGSCYRCTLAGADLSGKNLSEADLESADLTGADLSGASLKGANLKNVSFRNATLTKARLDKADLYKADFSGADLSGASFSGAETDEADFSGAIGYQTTTD